MCNVVVTMEFPALFTFMKICLDMGYLCSFQLHLKFTFLKKLSTTHTHTHTHTHIICSFKRIFIKVNKATILSEQFCDKFIITRSRVLTSRVHWGTRKKKFQSIKIKCVRIQTISIIINFSLVMIRCGFSSFYGT